MPRLVSGQFDPTTQKAVWPSTGNFCRGGAFDCALLGCQAVAILPEEMSRERFEWLSEIGAEVIATPGCESNVKEIFDKCWEIRRTRPDCVIFNQFEEFGNAVWHYHTTGSMVDEVFTRIARPGDRLAGLRLGDRLGRHDRGRRLPADASIRTSSVAAVEALQCPTLLQCGFGGHRIEGIGDKHVPWIHNVRNTDIVVAIDDEQCLQLMRLFNEPAGRAFLAGEGVAAVADRPAAAAGHLGHLQPGRGDQDGEALRDGTARRAVHVPHRFDAALPEPARGRAGPLRPLRPHRRGPQLRPLSRRRSRTDHLRELSLPGPQGDSQFEILHLGRAATAFGRRPQPALGPGLLDRASSPKSTNGTG